MGHIKMGYVKRENVSKPALIVLAPESAVR